MMCDSESGSDFSEGEESSAYNKYRNSIPLPLCLFEETIEKWYIIPSKTKTEAIHKMKLCSFWFPILLEPDMGSEIARWAINNNLIPSDNSEGMSVKNLDMIQAVDDLLQALERASMEKYDAQTIVIYCHLFNTDNFDFSHVVRFLRKLQLPGKEINMADRVKVFHPIPKCYEVLRQVFTEFGEFIQNMGGNTKRTMASLDCRSLEFDIQRSEEMKGKGNERFQKEKYKEAIVYYSRAIRLCPENHILYGNRALCYIRCAQYLKAASDGRCATLIKPLWAKGHYRYCESLFNMGAHAMAAEANASAQFLCKDDLEGKKNLEQQLLKFKNEMQTTGFGLLREAAERGRNGASSQSSSPKKAAKVKREKRPAKIVATAPRQGATKEPQPTIRESSARNVNVESNNGAKRKMNNKNNPAGEKKEEETKGVLSKKLRVIVQEAHTALVDLHSRNAEQAFSQALTLLETSVPKQHGLSTLDVLLLMFGRASALTDIGQPEELTEAKKILGTMLSCEHRTFLCLVYYAMGQVFVRENRFSVAAMQFSNSMQMVKNKITPGKLTWPLTKHTVRETQPEYFKEVLQSAIELCKFPPPPDAICRLEKCIYSVKAEIYFTDPDFKGFIQMCCCQSCTVEYHMACWKSLKTSVFNEKNEKDFLHEPCLTPDCVGFICNIKIYGPTGLVKCKFEATIQKPKTPKKPKVNQTCTSLKKLKAKEERKAKRKPFKESFQEKQPLNDETLQQKEGSQTQSQPKAWLLYRDRALLQINQNMELLRVEKNLQVSALASSLKPWLELDASRGNELAARILNWQPEQLPTLDEAAELILERKNRVWARVFVQQLSSCVGIDPKLSSWAVHLNDAGLNAARSFIELHSEHLEQLDLSLLLNFGPLQDMMTEKFGSRPEFFSSIGLTVTEYLKQVSPHDMRLFIWTLEEHREDYVSCHNLLDEYFDMMDGHCFILKKPDDENNSPMKTKNPSRKKKRRDQKGVHPMSVLDRNQDFIQEDSLAFLHPLDPFTVPSHLQEQVADFEEQYSRSRELHPLEFLFDDNPNPTKERLYEYFALILEVHGPLMADDPLLVGELEHFPPVARQAIAEAGGFEPFLLNSLRFIQIGQSIGLPKQAVLMQQTEPSASLDDLDLFPDPAESDPLTDFQMISHQDLTNGQMFYPFVQTEVHPILPSPYAMHLLPAQTNAFHQWSHVHHADYYFPYKYEQLDLYTTEVLGATWDQDSPAVNGNHIDSATVKQSNLKVDATMQTCEETMRSVAVNTEIYGKFESCQGDLNKKEKSNMKLQRKFQKLAANVDVVKVTQPKEVVQLEGEIQEVTANIQVTKQELLLFQQKLEDEVKKDQKEKKAHQEALKALKQEIEELQEEQRSLTRSVQEKKSTYEAKLHDFLELSNQSATEKMSLEDEIKRFNALLSSASRRSLATQLLVAESSRDQRLYGIRNELTDAKALLAKVDEMLQSFPNEQMEDFRNKCSATVEELTNKISTCEKQYQEQISQVKNGRRWSELPPGNVPNKTEPAAAAPSAAAPAARVTPPLLGAEAALPQKLPARFQDSSSNGTKFERTMEALNGMFPDYTRAELTRFLQTLRSSTGGSLHSMALHDVISGVTQIILDYQERRVVESSTAGRSSPARSAAPPVPAPPPAAPVWNPISNPKPASVEALNVEEPCCICCDNMDPASIRVLKCRHSFHDECIKSWLKDHSTCPTCRSHTLLNEDFPELPGRKRRDV